MRLPDRATVRAFLVRHRFGVASCLGIVVVWGLYVFSHSFPAGEGGYYLAVADRIASGGFAIPDRIPHYAPGGLPYAYPPLAFYVVAVIHVLTGLSLPAVALWITPAVVLVYTAGAYLLGLRVTGDELAAGLAAVLVGANPALLNKNLLADGYATGLALAAALWGLYVAHRQFESESWRLAAVVGVCLSVSLSSHPLVALFFAVSYLGFYFTESRTPTGLLQGAAVAVLGVGLSAWWWYPIVGTHGVEIYLAPGSTATPTVSLAKRMLFRYAGSGLGSQFNALLLLPLPVFGVAYAVVARRWTLVGWFAVTATVASGQMVGVYTVEAFVNAYFLAAVVFPAFASALSEWEVPSTARVATLRSMSPDREVVIRGLFIVTLLGATAFAGVFAVLMPAPDQEAREAMEWTRTNTDPEATFAVTVPTFAELFPFLAERTLIHGYWGTEWLGPTVLDRKRTQTFELGDCSSAGCLNDTLVRHGLRPDYVFVEKDGFDDATFRSSGRFRVRYRHESVVIASYRPQNATTGGPAMAYGAKSSLRPIP